MGEYLSEMTRLTARGQAQGIVFWAAVYAALVCAYSAIRQMLTWRWQATTGRLLRLGTRKFGESLADPSMQEYLSDALYEYQVNGRHYQGKEVSAWKVVASRNLKGILERQQAGIERQDDNDAITIYYNPARPAKALLIRPGWKSVLFTLAVGLAPTLYYLYRFS